MTDVVPVTMEEIIGALGEDRKLVMDAVKRLLDAGTLSARTDADEVKYLSVK